MTHIRQPKKFFLWTAVVLVTAALAVISYYTTIRFWWAYLMSINVITLLFYGYDKRRVIANGGRIPEAVLHLLAVLGGCVGAFAGQMIFRHKIRKLKFMLIFAATVIVQVVVVICWTLPDWQ